MIKIRIIVSSISQKLPLGHFKWVEETCEFNEDFIKSYNDESDMMKRIFSGS